MRFCAETVRPADRAFVLGLRGRHPAKGVEVTSGRVSIRSVAAAAGVATSTVSKALNGDRDISEATRARVREVARALGYRPMAQARGLARGRTGNVAVAVGSPFRPVFASAFYSEVLAGVEAELARHDLSLLLTSLKREDDLLRLVSERRADGVLYIGYDLKADFLRALARQVPLVVLDGDVPGLSGVVSRNAEGARAATEHLLAGGRRRLLFVTTTLEQPNFCGRFESFRAAVQGAGLEPGVLVVGADFGELRAALREQFAVDRPDGLFCAYDALGYTVLGVLETLGVRVPEGVAVVGYDGTAGSEHRKARLSTVAVDKHELGAAGVRLLLEHLQNATLEPQRVAVRTVLEPGDTS